MKVRISIFLTNRYVSKEHVYESLVLDLKDNPVFFGRLVESISKSYTTLVEPIDN